MDKAAGRLREKINLYSIIEFDIMIRALLILNPSIIEGFVQPIAKARLPGTLYTRHNSDNK